MFPRNVAILEAYVPTILLLFIAGAMITWVVDRVLSLTGLYRVVWHPALFVFSVYMIVLSSLVLAVGRWG